MNSAFAVALVDFLQPLYCPIPVLDVDNVIADLEVAEVGKKRGHFRLATLRARNHRFGFVKQIARAENPRGERPGTQRRAGRKLLPAYW